MSRTITTLLLFSVTLLQAHALPREEDPGWDRYVEGYALFMAGEPAAARRQFEAVMSTPGVRPELVADAGLRIGWLYHVAQRLPEAAAAFNRVNELDNAPLFYRAEAHIGLGQCRFDTGDVTAASNAFARAMVLLDRFRPEASDPPGWRRYARDKSNGLPAYAKSCMTRLVALSEDDSHYNYMMRRRPSKWPSPVERAARETVLEQLFAEHGLGPERCTLRGQYIMGTAAPSAPYPASGFPYRWEFDDGTLHGLSLTQGVERVRADAGCLKFTTRKAAGFGWGKTSRSCQHPPLRFGTSTNLHESCPPLSGIRVRMRQSLPRSVWRARVGRWPRRSTSGYQARESRPVTLHGTDWQEIAFRVNAGDPPYLGVHFLTDTPGNEVEIAWVRPETHGGVCARRELEVPAPVRWAKVSVSASRRFRLYVNGRQAVASPPNMDIYQLWNFDLDPALFRAGANVVAFEGEANTVILIDGALLCMDGTHVRFDSDDSWRSGIPEPDAPWMSPEFEPTETWETARLLDEMKTFEARYAARLERFWFNPSYKGGIMIEPADGRPQPVYGSREPVALHVAVPMRAGDTPELRWTLFDAMGNGVRPADREVDSGQLNLKPSPGMASADVRFAPGKLEPNVAYALVAEWSANGETRERRRYELAVCGPVALPEINNPTHYTDGMELKLVWELDAAEEPPPEDFISVDGNGRPRPSDVIETPLGRFRRPYPERNLGSAGGGPCNYISYRYRVENPGRPHVAIAEYPDDTVRVQEMRLTEGGNSVFRYGTANRGLEIGNDTVVLGFDHPLTHELRHHHCLFFPGQRKGTVTFLTIGRSDMDAARVGNIRIYEVLNDVPARRMADAPGPPKWVGQLSEAGPRQIFQSCFSSPLAGHIYARLIASESPVFYRNWMVTAINLVKRMKFAGENAQFCGQFMYRNVLYPSVFSDTTAFASGYSGSLRDYGVLLARMLEENGLGFFSAIQMGGFSRLKSTVPDEAVAAGHPCLSQITRDGAQAGAKFGTPFPNWLLPENRAYYETVIEELIALYAGEPGWKGIVIHLFGPYGNGPLWHSTTRDPYFASYDDITIAMFEEETGIRIPDDVDGEGKGSERFSRRADWLLHNALSEWTQWRCEKISDIHEWTRDRLKATRPDLTLIMYPYSPGMEPPLDEQPEDALPSIFDYARRGGLDLERIKNDPGMILAANVFVTLRMGGSETIKGDFGSWMSGAHDEIGMGRALAHRESSLTPFANDGKNGLAVRYNWYEAQPTAPAYWQWTYTAPESWPYPEDDYFADYWINSFVRTHPSLILHPLTDQVLWNGREVSMSKFARAFRSLPSIVYTQLKGHGRDRNVRIAVGTVDGQTYGYVANCHWWDTDVTLELALKGVELTSSSPTEDGAWQGQLKAYSMRTFRFGGTPEAPIAACDAIVGEAGQAEIERLLDQWRTAYKAHRKALDAVGRGQDFAARITKAAEAWSVGDGATAYDCLTEYAARRLWDLLEKREYSAFITEGWTLSEVLPRENRRNVRSVEPIAANDRSLKWRPVRAHGSNRVLAHNVYGDRDGFVYFANRLMVSKSREWTLCLGHDGGCRVFIDGREVLCEPRRRNPIREDRTKATVKLEPGVHEVVVALDLDHGLGYGFVMRFRGPGGQEFPAMDFPIPLPRDSANAP